jgi:predicted ATP-grasp superfamily ATP-dependent carboligase
MIVATSTGRGKRGRDVAGRLQHSRRIVNVLVTGGDHVGALAAVRALRRAGYGPWVAASGPQAYAARSRAAAGVIFAPDAGRDPDGFIERLRVAAADVGVRAVLCGTERDLVAVAGSRDRLGGLATGTPDPAVVRRITSKATVNELARQVGISIPETIEVGRATLPDTSGLSPPLAVKPMRSELASSAGGLVHRNVERVETRDQLRRLPSALPGERLLVQPWLHGPLGAICGVAWQGEVVAAMHQRARRIWPPDVGVSAYAHTVERDPELEDRVASLIGLLGWSGIFQAQFIHADTGPHLIDLNPRIYGSLALATAAGVNLPAIWVALLTGSPVPARTYRVGVRYRSEELDSRALLHLVMTGRSAEAWRGLIPRRHTVHAVGALADPFPLLTSLGKLRRRLRRRLLAQPGARSAT